MIVTILSLVFNGLQTAIIAISVYLLLRQLKQFDQSLRNDAYSKAVDYYVKTNELLFDKPHIVNLFYPPDSDFINLSDDQKRLYVYLVLILGFFERLYQLYQMKSIDKKTWASWERWLLEAVLPLDIFKLIWKYEHTYFHEDFSKYVSLKLNEYLKTKKDEKEDSRQE